MKMELTEKQQEVLVGLARTLNLLDGYMSTQNQGMVLGWEGGMMTWEELRVHATSARFHLVQQFKGLAPELEKLRS